MSSNASLAPQLNLAALISTGMDRGAQLEALSKGRPIGRESRVRRARRIPTPTLFCNSDLDKSTTAPPFVRWGIWNIHVHKVHVYEVYAHEVHAYEVYAHEIHAYEVHAYEMNAREVYSHEIHAHK